MITAAFAAYGADPMSARRMFQALAKAGDPRAQTVYALMLSGGQGGGKDPFTAAHWYLKAANQGHPVACYSLAAFHADQKDPSTAIRWFTRAAELGDRDALVMLGTLATDPTEALGWWRRAATRGHPGAMVAIGRAYAAEGDVATAAEWFLDAAEARDEEAVHALARVLGEVRAAAETGSPAAAWVAAAFASDAAEGGRLMELAASKGHGRACHRLAGQVRKGDAPGGLPRMIELLARGAAAGSEDAQHDLATAYNSGTGVEVDRRAAVSWYRKAATWGRPASLNDLGATLIDVATSEEEQQEAMDALRGAALGGYALGMYVYALHLAETDPVEALRWLLEAADAGHGAAVTTARELAAGMTPEDVRLADQRTQTDGSVAEGLLAERAVSNR